MRGGGRGERAARSFERLATVYLGWHVFFSHLPPSGENNNTDLANGHTHTRTSRSRRAYFIFFILFFNSSVHDDRASALPSAKISYGFPPVADCGTHVAVHRDSLPAVGLMKTTEVHHTPYAKPLINSKLWPNRSPGATSTSNRRTRGSNRRRTRRIRRV